MNNQLTDTIWTAVTRLERQDSTYEERMAAADALRVLATRPPSAAAGEVPTGWKLVPAEPTFAMLDQMARDYFPQDWEAGKTAQRRLGLDVIPPKTEYEKAYGHYARVIAAAPQPPAAAEAGDALKRAIRAFTDHSYAAKHGQPVKEAQSRKEFDAAMEAIWLALCAAPTSSRAQAEGVDDLRKLVESTLVDADHLATVSGLFLGALNAKAGADAEHDLHDTEATSEALQRAAESAGEYWNELRHAAAVYTKRAAKLRAALAATPSEPTDEEIVRIFQRVNGRYSEFNGPLNAILKFAREVLSATPSEGAPAGQSEGAPAGLLMWAVRRWEESVKHRPMANIHRRTLDDVWREVIRFAGGDADALIGPSHDALAAAQPTNKGGEHG